MRPIGWMSDESANRLFCGGNDSRGTVPLHARKSAVSSIPAFDEDAIKQTRLDALEEAAKICDEFNGTWFVYRKGAKYCADAIRALKVKE